MAAKRIPKEKKDIHAMICGQCMVPFIPDPSDPRGKNYKGNCEHHKTTISRR
jgi:hypothetical protein